MAGDRKVEEMQKTILLMEEELERLKNPPYMSGTILDVGKDTARVSIDGDGIYEIPSNTVLREKARRGSRVILNPATKAVIGSSEFNSLGGEVVIVDEVLNDRLMVQNKGESYVVLNSVDGVKPG